MKKPLNPAEYVEQMSQVIDLSIDPEYYPGVVRNFMAICAIAKLVTEFSLPDEIEAAPRFEP